MSAQSHPPLGDVSCRATGYTIQQLQRMGLQTAHLTRGLAHTLDDLQSHSGSIPWDDYLVFLRNSDGHLTPDQLVELCTAYKGSSYLRPLLSAAGLWFHPAKYFQWVADLESGAIRQLFRCVSTRFTQTGDREVVIEEVVEPGFALPPDIFWETQSIAFGALTTYFGLAPSIVTWEPVARGAAFRVRLPRRRPVRFVLSWFASWFRRDTAEDIRSALSFGHARSLRLEREIAERKTAEVARRDSGERFQRITDAVPGTVYQYYLDPDGRQGFVLVSGGATALTGYTPEELVARPELIWERIDPDDIPGVQRAILESARNGTPWQHEFRFRTKAGDNRWVRGRSIPQPMTATGRVVWNGILTDVTAEKQAEEQLRARDALLRKLSEQVPGFIYQYQQWPDGRSCFPYASEGIRDIYEVAPAEVRGSAEAVFARLHPEDFYTVAESIRRSNESLEPWRCEYRVRLPERGTRWLDGHAVPERLPDGSTIWHGHIRDVTDRKRAEDTLRESEERYRRAERGTNDGLWEWNIATGEDYFSPRWMEMLGYQPGELPYHVDTFAALIHPDDKPAVLAAVEWHFQRGDPYHVQTRLRCKSGEYLWVESRGLAERDAAGKPIRMTGSITDITERRRTEQALRESEYRLGQAIRVAQIGIFDHDHRTDEIYWSREQQIINGWPEKKHRVALADYIKLVHPDDRERIAEVVRLAHDPTGDGLFDVEHRIIRPNGTLRWLDTRSQTYFEGEGTARHPVRTVGAVLDITARKFAEEEIRRARDAAERALADLQVASARAEQFYRLCEVAGQGIGIARLDGALTYMNPAFRRMLELPDGDEITRRAFWELVPSDSHQFLAETVLRQARETGSWSGEFDLLTLTGKRVPIINTVVLLRDPDGTVVGYSNVATNITEQKRTEAALRESEDKLRTIIDNEPECVKLLDSRGRLLEMNPAGLRMVEAAGLDQILGTEVGCLVANADRAAFDDTVVAVFRGESRRLSFEMRGLAGTRRVVESHCVPLWGPDGSAVRALLGVTRDVTDRVQAEAALRESEMRYRTLIETSSDAIFLMDLTGRILSANPAAVRMHGYTIDELLAMRMQDLDLPDHAADLPDRMRRLRAGESLTFEVVHRRKDGTTFPLEVIASAVEIGGEWTVIGFDRDITDRKRVETELRESEERLRLALSAATAVAFVWDVATDSVVRYFSTEPALPANPHAPEPVAAVVARVHPDDRAQFAAGIAECLADDSEYRNLYRVLRPDGTARWLEEWGSLGRDRTGHPVRLTGISIDVNERKLADAALQLAERRQRLALDAGRMGTWDWEVGSDRLTWDDREQRLFGFAPGEFDGRLASFLDRVHPDDLAGVRQVLADAAVGTDFDGEFRIRLASGEVRWIHGSGVTVPKSEHSPPRLVGINYDVTERKRAEETVRQILDGIAPRTGREFFRVLVDYLCQVCEVQFAFAGGIDPNNPNLVRTIAVSHRGQVADNFTYDLRGTPCEKVVGHTFCSFPAGVQQLFPDDTMLVDMGIDGYLGTPLWSNSGQPLGLIVLLHDRPVPYPEQAGVVLKVVAARAGAELERQQADAALRESEGRLRIFVENAPAGVAMLDREVRYLSYSRRWLADYGLGDQNLIGRSHYEVFPEVTDRWKEIHRRCLTGVSQRCEQDRFERADGTVDYLRWEIQPWTDATGAVGGLVFFTEMITDRVRAEDQVRASLREKEAMLKEIHHRVKNNLQVISSLLSLQAARVTHPAATDVLAESQNRVRAMALVHETLYRSDDLARVDLSRYLGELCGYLFRSYGMDSARVRLELDVEPVTVSLDKTIPCGLLVNEIVSNSLKYAFPGTRSGTVTVGGRTRPDGYLTLTLADDGVGLPAEVVVDRTPSLGLQLVNILTEQIGGQLTVERTPGTRFVITFAP